MRQGRMTWAELAGQVDLSAPGAADRARRLEERQMIRACWCISDSHGTTPIPA
ncbi:MAG: Lrp/AsnC family transcriptional regulator [Microcoleus sp. SIO2G3]|nr:Lrp/AsnC family transcriptional regulator [Microcoleus sp. SIO2G3]